MKIGFLGLSHLSINYAASASEKGCSVFCYDRDIALVESAKNFQLDYSEPGLASLLKKNVDRLTFTDDLKDLQDCDILYIAKDVPTDASGSSDLSAINDLVGLATTVAGEKTAVGILCQVPPGYTRSIMFDDARLFYQVETLIFGQALERALCPERFIVGCRNPHNPLPRALEAFLNTYDCPILKMRYESAELAKISINLFLISSVVTTNTIADICENINADWFEIRESLRLDKRIGPHAYLSPGLGLSGGNLERDLATILGLSYKYGSKSGMLSSWIEDCKYRRDWVLRKLCKNVLPGVPNPTIGVLGIAYKPNTLSIKNSPSLYLMDQIKKFKIKAFDPVVKQTPFQEVEIVETAEMACDVDVLIIMTPWEEFKNINFCALSGVKALIDPYSMIQPSTVETLKYNYYAIGRS